MIAYQAVVEMTYEATNDGRDDYHAGLHGHHESGLSRCARCGQGSPFARRLTGLRPCPNLRAASELSLRDGRERLARWMLSATGGRPSCTRRHARNSDAVLAQERAGPGEGWRAEYRAPGLCKAE